MLKIYNPAYWFWQVGDDTSRYWSSSATAYVTDKPEQFTRVSSEAELRDVLAAAGFAERAPGYVPTDSVALWQLKAAIDADGKLAVADALASKAPPAVRIAWEYAPLVSSLSPAVVAFGAALGYDTPEKLVALFDRARKMRV